MKYILYILLFTFSTTFSQQNIAKHKPKSFHIEKDTIQNSNNIYLVNDKLYNELIDYNPDKINLDVKNMTYRKGDKLFEYKLAKDTTINFRNTSKDKVRDDYSFQWEKIFTPLIAVLAAWLLAFIPQKRQNIQHTFFELMKNQMDLLNRIDFNTNKINGKIEKKGAGFFIYANEKITDLYNFISTEFYEENNPHILNPISTQITNAAFDICNDILTQEELEKLYNERPQRIGDESETTFEKRKCKYVYNYLFARHSTYLGHYFRHLFNVIKFLKRNRFWLWFNDKKFYIGLVQAQMSTAELVVLFFNGLIFDRMGEYINRYNLIENLGKKNLLKPIHEEFYTVKIKD